MHKIYIKIIYYIGFFFLKGYKNKNTFLILPFNLDFPSLSLKLIFSNTMCVVNTFFARPETCYYLFCGFHKKGSLLRRQWWFEVRNFLESSGWVHLSGQGTDSNFGLFGRVRIILKLVLFGTHNNNSYSYSFPYFLVNFHFIGVVIMITPREQLSQQ